MTVMQRKGKKKVTEKELLQEIVRVQKELAPSLVPESTFFELGRAIRLLLLLYLLAKKRGLIPKAVPD